MGRLKCTALEIKSFQSPLAIEYYHITIRTLEPGERALESAGKVSEPAGRALKPAERPLEQAA